MVFMEQSLQISPTTSTSVGTPPRAAGVVALAHDPAVRADYNALFSVAQDAIEHLNKKQKNQLTAWTISDVVATDLYTDESFVRIPPRFVSRFSSLTPKTVKLICSLKGSWMVVIEEEDNKELYFKRGWNTFVEDNALETGQFIVFKLNGDSMFKATIFRNPTCEKELENQPCINLNYCIT
ncbi:hypothetical protein K1719_016201 [Acacia pycnantha]|nr:hypothetical protein K1719_016201 [Acacia pycnantha]